MSPMSKSTQRWVTSASYSTKEEGSSRRVRRSRAVSLPLECCAEMREGPPPRREEERREGRREVKVEMGGEV